MYIRKASRTVRGKTYCHYLLVESRLTPQGPRQKVICSLGDLSPRPKEQWLELARKLENALTGQQDLFASPSPDPELETLVAKVKAGPRRRRAQQDHQALGNPQARRGYWRDHRGDCQQVLVGLAVNRDGFPLAHEVMAGNRHDSTALEEMLAAFDQRVGRREACVVCEQRAEGKGPRNPAGAREAAGGGFSETGKARGQGPGARRAAGGGAAIHGAAQGALLAGGALLPDGVRRPGQRLPLQSR